MNTAADASGLSTLLDRVRECTLCEPHLPRGARPVLAASRDSRIALVSQAPGARVHESGVPWDDESGRRLRAWLDVDDRTFYDASNFAILPIGFCYPGTRPGGGDLPPRRECAPQWHPALWERLPRVRTTILIGNHAQRHYLGKRRERNLTETVRRHERYAPGFFPLVHPSPLNHGWHRKNPWFEAEVVPALRRFVREALSGGDR